MFVHNFFAAKKLQKNKLPFELHELQVKISVQDKNFNCVHERRMAFI